MDRKFCVKPRSSPNMGFVLTAIFIIGSLCTSKTNCTLECPEDSRSVDRNREKRYRKHKVHYLPQHLKPSILPPSVPQRRRLRRSATHVTSSKGLALFWVFQNYDHETKEIRPGQEPWSVDHHGGAPSQPWFVWVLMWPFWKKPHQPIACPGKWVWHHFAGAEENIPGKKSVC